MLLTRCRVTRTAPGLNSWRHVRITNMFRNFRLSGRFILIFFIWPLAWCQWVRVFAKEFIWFQCVSGSTQYNWIFEYCVCRSLHHIVQNNGLAHEIWSGDTPGYTNYWRRACWLLLPRDGSTFILVEGRRGRSACTAFAGLSKNISLVFGHTTVVPSSNGFIHCRCVIADELSIKLRIMNLCVRSLLTLCPGLKIRYTENRTYSTITSKREKTKWKRQ